MFNQLNSLSPSATPINMGGEVKHLAGGDFLFNVMVLKKKRNRNPHKESTKILMRIAASKVIHAKKYILPEHEIVERLLNTPATTRSIAQEYGCGDATIKVLFRKHTTKEQRLQVKSDKQSASITGELAPNWKGGLTAEKERIRGTAKYKNWRLAVFTRDNFTCQKCGAKSGQGKAVVLNAHHLREFALYPDLRFELSNGLTLCEPCHIETDSYRGKPKSKKK